eukprot:TRINITY_DN1849_c0_g1_i2.p1 TRINITY_DN1849_c0_g1~~TRINITY_DN1849_c0_g1_i2.p1  ORF type:complete len:268 (+),score=35.15 TRINITY_DN1849_c0_g1_i2:133-936(+)
MSVNQIAFLVVLFLVVGTSSRSPTSWRHPYSVDPLSNPLFTELLELQAGKYGDLVQNNSLRLSPLAVFNCTLTGRTNPTSAKRLLPGDIDVVAALGDSIVAGFGALATSIFGVFTEYRGYSFPIGGQEPFSEFVTLPNILRLYNPNLIGFSVGNGKENSANSKLNVAVTGARSYDLLEQVNQLESKISSMGINLQTTWKLITIFIGGNDLCDYCTDTTKFSPENYQKNVEVCSLSLILVVLSLQSTLHVFFGVLMDFLSGWEILGLD